ncbi:hypothetical protein [Glycomyces sambucus]|uniref:hypothetical protein n=1 Tax=Glycomyces sambucus TaxID=380244 RepID=UPI000B84C633|nr:hypothetical protein [Glycomyces sambucus]
MLFGLVERKVYGVVPGSAAWTDQDVQIRNLVLDPLNVQAGAPRDQKLIRVEVLRHMTEKQFEELGHFEAVILGLG